MRCRHDSAPRRCCGTISELHKVFERLSKRAYKRSPPHRDHKVDRPLGHGQTMQAARRNPEMSVAKRAQDRAHGRLLPFTGLLSPLTDDAAKQDDRSLHRSCTTASDLSDADWTAPRRNTSLFLNQAGSNAHSLHRRSWQVPPLHAGAADLLDRPPDAVLRPQPRQSAVVRGPGCQAARSVRVLRRQRIGLRGVRRGPNPRGACEPCSSFGLDGRKTATTYGCSWRASCTASTNTRLARTPSCWRAYSIPSQLGKWQNPRFGRWSPTRCSCATWMSRSRRRPSTRSMNRKGSALPHHALLPQFPVPVGIVGTAAVDDLAQKAPSRCARVRPERADRPPCLTPVSIRHHSLAN
jgi:hypothetical protein